MEGSGTTQANREREREVVGPNVRAHARARNLLHAKG